MTGGRLSAWSFRTKTAPEACLPVAYEDGLCSLCAQECGCWRVLLKRHQQAFLVSSTSIALLGMKLTADSAARAASLGPLPPASSLTMRPTVAGHHLIRTTISSCLGPWTTPSCAPMPWGCTSDPKDVRCSSTLLTHSKGSENGTNRLRLQKQILKTEKNRPLDPEMQCLLLSDGKGSIHPNHVVILPGDSGSGTAAISFTGALKIPGVIEFSLCLLFAKLVSYTFLFWLPLYITNVDHLDAKKAGELSTLFDVGGIFGGILAGVISDRLEKRASTCGLMLLLAAPTLYIFSTISKMGLEATIAMLLLSGALVSGPYALITTAVSADLGTHKSLKGNAHALSTVTAIIDGTGSVGAALGPLLAGLLSPSGWSNVFYMLMFADACALLVSRPIFSPIHLECGSLWLWPNTGGTFSRAFLSYQTDLGLPIFSKYA
ncbi:glucose-6-phosphate exchanger SLC37A1 isoform X9 [Papio anubis]|uniref:glucose-6-phosphate exchanger SLC37A1 isoform X9 n=1 Tax=Papio anubis TaxID=9555 RepID=UPI0012AE53DA|nr:glucose-6-phosphate exchanger SLC37A1 isoform X9 [Papio anubis]